MPRHVGQHRFVLRITEKYIERFFKLAKGDAQLTHHTAHGLFVTDAAIQLFHPGFQRLRLATLPDIFKALGQVPGTHCQLGIVGVKVVKCRFQIQH